jgi:hypothetical protein
MQPPNFPDFAYFVKQHKEILEKLFPPDWFQTPRSDHLAYQQWAFCKRILDQGGVLQFPEQQAQIFELARIIVNSGILVTVTGGDIQQLQFGSLNIFGDEVVRKMITSRIAVPEQFEDVMVELSFAAWHGMHNNHHVTPLEEKGLPDFKLELPELNYPVFAECKNVKSGASNRLRKVISKANSQIKATNELCYGVAVLDVSIPIAFEKVENDQFSDRLEEIISFVHSAISGPKNRSIGDVILTWDDYMVKGNPPEPTLVVFRRRSKRISHSPREDIKSLPSDVPLFDGFTGGSFFLWEDRKR